MLHHAAGLTADGHTELVNRQAAFLINPWPANSASWPGRKKTAFFYFKLILWWHKELKHNFVNKEPKLAKYQPKSCQSFCLLQVSSLDTAIPRTRGRSNRGRCFSVGKLLTRQHQPPAASFLCMSQKKMSKSKHKRNMALESVQQFDKFPVFLAHFPCLFSFIFL